MSRPKTNDFPDAFDPVSGVVAPIAMRTLRAAARAPLFILVGDKKPASEWSPGRIASEFAVDANQLHDTFYENLPAGIYEGLVRHYLATMAKDFSDRRDYEKRSAVWAVMDILADRLRAPQTYTDAVDAASLVTGS